MTDDQRLEYGVLYLERQLLKLHLDYTVRMRAVTPSTGTYLNWRGIYVTQVCEIEVSDGGTGQGTSAASGQKTGGE